MTLHATLHATLRNRGQGFAIAWSQQANQDQPGWSRGLRACPGRGTDGQSLDVLEPRRVEGGGEWLFIAQQSLSTLPRVCWLVDV